MIDFLCRADSREEFEAMAKSQGFMTEDGHPVEESLYDPTPGTPEYETGIPMPANPQPVTMDSKRDRSQRNELSAPAPTVLLPGFYFNFRVWGQKEIDQMADLPQTDQDGKLLPLRERTTFGAWMVELGVEGTQENLETTTTFVTASGVSFIDPESIRTRRRVWQ
jgi:hypothetical protein